MDKITKFESLFRGQFMPEIDYRVETFTFRTVCMLNAYSYRLCECAFEHEYFDYVSCTGEINGEIFNKIKHSISHGECPHVRGVDERCITKTCVYAMHIAFVVGTDKTVKEILSRANRNILCFVDTGHHREFQFAGPGGIYDISPYHLALLREKYTIIESFHGAISRVKNSCIESTNIISAARVDTNHIRIETYTLPGYFMVRRNTQLLKLVLSPYYRYNGHYISGTLCMTFKHGLREMQDILIKYINTYFKLGAPGFYNINAVRDCAVAAIVYNKPGVLKIILKLDAVWFQRVTFEMWPLYEICSVLKREGCLDVLKHSGLREPVRQDFDPIFHLFYLVRRYMYNEDFGTEILSRLREVKTIKQYINTPNNEGMTRLRLCGDRCPQGNRIYDLREMKMLLQLGADVDVVDEKGKTILSDILGTKLTSVDKADIRNALDLILFENPSTELNKDAVEESIELDEESGKSDIAFGGDYIMDGQEHSLFGKECYALNFFGPLLLEAGFRGSKQALIRAAADNKYLNQSECDYIRVYLDTPRRLMSCCRDTIRTFFKGRQLHQYVGSKNIPEKIKDYILLKDILLTLKN